MDNADPVRETTPEQKPPSAPPPPLPNSEPWIVQSLNHLNGRVGEVEKDVKSLLKDSATLKESTKILPKIEDKLSSMEKRYWIALGAFLVLTYLAGYLFSNFSITILPGK